MRIRTIKPEFFNHEGIYDAELQSNLPLRLAFIGLWCAADREGRFKWEPRRLGVQILPYDNVDFSRVLDALATRGFVSKYVCENVHYGVIPTFPRHQVINNREKESELPKPLQYIDCDAWVTREARDEDAGKAEGKGREGNKEGKGKTSCPIPSDEKECAFIWSNTPSASKMRSSKKKLAEAWKKLRIKPTLEQLKTGLDAWNKCPKWRDGYSEGIHIWIQNEQWENLPEPTASKPTTTHHDRHANDPEGGVIDFEFAYTQ